MGREEDNDDRPLHETLSFAEFNARSASPQAEGERVSLVLADSEAGERVFAVTRNPTVIGRSTNADLVLDDPTASDQHARLIKHNFGYTIEDMGSAEGTFLGDKRINHARIVNGNSFRIGKTVITFRHEQASSPRPAKPKRVTNTLVPVRATSRGMSPRPTQPRDPFPATQELRHIRQEAPAPETATRSRPRTSRSEEVPASLDDIILKIILASRFIRRNLVRIVVPVVVCGALAGASFKYFPPVRAAFCIVTLYPDPKTNPIDPSAQQARTETMQFFAGAERAFVSSALVLAALKRLGVPKPTEQQAEAISKLLRFEGRGNNTYVATFTPKFFSPRGDSHVQYLDTHVKTYVESEIEKILKVFVAEVDFLRGETDTAEKNLAAVVREMVAFREAHSDQILAQGSMSAGSQADLETRRIALIGQISRLEGELTGVRGQLTRGSALGQAKAQSAQSDRDALDVVTRKLAELRAQGFAEGHPDIQRLLAEQKSLEAAVEAHLHSEVSPFEKNANVAYDSVQSRADQLEAALRAARAERGTIENSLRSIRAVSSLSPMVNARLEELTRKKEEMERQQALLFDKLQKAEVQLQLERVSATSRYEIVIPAKLDPPPGKKALLIRVILGLAVGALIAGLLIGFVELRKRIAHATRESGMAVLLLFGLVGSQSFPFSAQRTMDRAKADDGRSADASRVIRVSRTRSM